MKELSLESLFGDADIDMECPGCQQHFTIKFNEVLNDQSTVDCPSCNQTIEIVHDDTTKETLSNSTKALGDFEKSLQNLEKSFKKLGK